jgi:hypothetical protein
VSLSAQLLELLLPTCARTHHSPVLVHGSQSTLNWRNCTIPAHDNFKLNSLRYGQTSPPHKPEPRRRLMISHSTFPPLSPSPLANSFTIGTAVLNNNTSRACGLGEREAVTEMSDSMWCNHAVRESFKRFSALQRTQARGFKGILGP